MVVLKVAIFLNMGARYPDFEKVIEVSDARQESLSFAIILLTN